MSTMLLEPKLETPTVNSNPANYYVASINSQAFAYDASVKPRKDIQALATKAGYNPAYLPMFTNYSNRLQEKLETIEDNSLVLLQVPTYNSLATDRAMVDGLKAKGCTLVMWVHDIDCLRGFHESPYEDMLMLDKADIVIVPSKKMLDWVNIHTSVTQQNFIVHEAWDYLTELGEVEPNSIFNKPAESNICYAGNLSSAKVDFLQTINTDIDVYGKGNQAKFTNNNVHYQGCASAEYLPKVLKKYSAGLVWDSGNYNHYLDYNWSHKASLYLASGIPVIAKKGTHVGNFAEDHNCGVTIKSLDELKDLHLPENLTVHEIGKDMRRGYFINRTLDVINQIIDLGGIYHEFL